MTKIDMNINRREIPVKPENRIVKFTKLESGALAVEFANGSNGIIPANETDIQAFAVYSVLAGL